MVTIYQRKKEKLKIVIKLLLLLFSKFGVLENYFESTEFQSRKIQPLIVSTTGEENYSKRNETVVLHNEGGWTCFTRDGIHKVAATALRTSDRLRSRRRNATILLKSSSETIIDAGVYRCAGRSERRDRGRHLSLDVARGRASHPNLRLRGTGGFKPRVKPGLINSRRDCAWGRGWIFNARNHGGKNIWQSSLSKQQ